MQLQLCGHSSDTLSSGQSLRTRSFVTFQSVLPWLDDYIKQHLDDYMFGLCIIVIPLQEKVTFKSQPRTR